MTFKLLHDKDLLQKINVDKLPGFYDTSNFEYLEFVEKNFSTIYQEWQEVTQKQDLYQSWPQNWIYNSPELWTIIPLLSKMSAHPDTSSLELKSQFFPKTIEILKSALGERLCDAAFSRLGPNAKIFPHHGRFSNVLRCHLGLKIPTGDCKIKVGQETQTWKQGKILVLDDRLMHEAWNSTDSERIVLIFDFIPDEIPGFFPYQ